ncbi:hypothetical protein RUM44_010415 [Polyplax serrata]|uniref:NOL1/NOP2/Sun domain family member 4 n=1 Tax=Polyplax serrata TaxID=468196 RepID=A0ABR1AVS4_POLSC
MFLYKSQRLNNTVRLKTILKVIKRNAVFKYQRPKQETPCDRALKHFDAFYKSIFRDNWPSVRLGLLSRYKKIAVINNFGDNEETANILEEQGAINLRSYFEVQKRLQNERVHKKRSAKDVKGDELDKTIQKEILQQEEAEMNEIYPSNKIVSSKARFAVGEDDVKEKEEYFYDPEETTTSLEYDVSKAEIDTSRLILPNSDSNDTSLFDFVPVSKLRSDKDYISESEYYKYYQPKFEYEIEIEKEEEFDFPENLKVYTFPRGDFTEFSEPMKCSNNVHNYLLMNGADVLPVLALGVKEGDIVLDMLPNFGNPAFCLFQTLRPKILTCNSNHYINSLFSKYLYDFSPTWKDMLLVTKFNFRDESNNDLFDKVLLDINCTDDRLSVTEENMNYFAVRNIQFRLKLPETQSSLLKSALEMVRPGGTVVYTSRTMCPIQNDGVVSQTLHSIWNEKQKKYCIK